MAPPAARAKAESEKKTGTPEVSGDGVMKKILERLAAESADVPSSTADKPTSQKHTNFWFYVYICVFIIIV